MNGNGNGRWGSLKPLRVDLDEIAAAMDHLDRSVTEHFLDLETGEVITLSVSLLTAIRQGLKLSDTDLPEWVLEDEPLARAALGDPHGKRFMRIPEGTWINMGEMRVRFVRAIKSPGILQQFADAATAHDDGTRFNALLKSYPELSTAWFRFEARQKQSWAREWLERIGIEAV
jgi:hypothetical protein